MGYRFQKYFSIRQIDFDKFENGTSEFRSDIIKRVGKILLSPKELDEFKGIERFDYMKERGYITKEDFIL